MHSDLASHLHTQECNEIIAKLQKCHIEHPFGKFWGYCNDLDFAMTKCLRREKENKRAENRLKAEERVERMRRMREEERTAKKLREENPVSTGLR
ncbi:COX assembly mitochondrial protein 2 homolog [Paramacrobiotus metropolitanus]|uniref:COX assembly mitochondrial protein 2 homolog n=1 Tax=Paramacrobiotus metropolitanus TaxID=2943436 RepID=UPI00244617F1|nr:COX assembly mitochondrial protein 2 homolog [Paramacrobiotus metropolitanus]